MKYQYVVGIDEAGYGCMAGDLFMSAVALPVAVTIPLVRDSKKLSDACREELVDIIWATAAWHKTVDASPQDIDSFGLGTCWGRLVQDLSTAAFREFRDNAEFVIDGNRNVGISFLRAVVKADDKYPAVMAASILSKYSQTCCMDGHHRMYPQYGFDRHRGYVTRAHLAAVKEHGVCQIHRRSYRPLKKILWETLTVSGSSSTSCGSRRI